MIDKAQLRGFRKHKKLNVEFGANVNSIVGSSYAGKSTLIRALDWCINNQPPGLNVINWDMDRAAVRLTISDHSITRTRTRQSKNAYEIESKGESRDLQRLAMECLIRSRNS